MAVAHFGNGYKFTTQFYPPGKTTGDGFNIVVEVMFRYALK
jgi:hypothetical protein